jgi:epoxyqueuosine reductase
LVALLRSTDEELMARFGRWYLPRRRPEYLRRNALVVLANIADGSHPGVVEVVTGALQDGRAVVRAHAVWAARRLGLDDLLGLVAGDDDPWVLAELAEPVPARERVPS